MVQGVVCDVRNTWAHLIHECLNFLSGQGMSDLQSSHVEIWRWHSPKIRGNFSEALLDLSDKRSDVTWWSGPKDQAMPPILEVGMTFRIFYFRQNLVNGDTAEIRGK